jgi:hypothetical protein
VFGISRRAAIDYRLPITKVGPLAHPVRSHTLAHRVQNNSKHTPMGPSWRKKGRQSKHKHKANNHILFVLYVAEHVARSVTDTIGSQALAHAGMHSCQLTGSGLMVRLRTGVSTRCTGQCGTRASTRTPGNHSCTTIEMPGVQPSYSRITTVSNLCHFGRVVGCRFCR